MTAEPLDLRAALAAALARFAGRLERADLAAPVPSCPGWDVADLAGHLGGVHRWATAAVLEGRPRGDRGTAPRDREALLAWFRDGATALLAALDADPDRPCWTLGEPRTARSWIRRQAHETALHARDLAEAMGEPEPLDPRLAADGIGEVLDVMLPRQVGLGRLVPPSAGWRLRATDAGPGHTWQHPGDPDLGEVAGPAEALLLLLWRRVTLGDDRLTVGGDRAALAAVLAEPLTP